MLSFSSLAGWLGGGGPEKLPELPSHCTAQGAKAGPDLEQQAESRNAEVHCLEIKKVNANVVCQTGSWDSG